MLPDAKECIANVLAPYHMSCGSKQEFRKMYTLEQQKEGKHETIVVRRYHHTLCDIKKLLGSCLCLSESSQKFFGLALNDCPPHECKCKGGYHHRESPDGSNADALFTALYPCPKAFESQTFNEWKRQATLNAINRKIAGMHWRTSKLKLQFLPVGPFPLFVRDYRTYTSRKSLWDLLTDFLRLFFTGCDVEILPEVDISTLPVRKRFHSFTGKEQYLVTDFFPVLKRVIGKDAYCVIAVTWNDLYPSENLNFVLGQASFDHYCCVASFGRFDPTYVKGFKGNEHGIPVDQMCDISRIDGSLIWKLIKVLTHEICHVFGMLHCGIFACLMNASFSSEEALSQPLVLCPLCMRKLLHACSTWPGVKNLFEVKSHLASISQYLSCLFLPILSEELDPGDSQVKNTKKKALATLRWIKNVLEVIQ